MLSIYTLASLFTQLQSESVNNMCLCGEYVCVSVSVCVYLHVSVSVFVCVSVCLHVSLCVSVSMCVSLCASVELKRQEVMLLSRILRESTLLGLE